MPDDLRDIHDDDQWQAERRALAEALARDAVAYRDTLAGAGITGDLLDLMTRDFGQRWVTQQTTVPDLMPMLWEGE